MRGKAVRVSVDTHILLLKLSERTGETIKKVLAVSVEEYDKKLFWEETNRAFRISNMEGE